MGTRREGKIKLDAAEGPTGARREGRGCNLPMSKSTRAFAPPQIPFFLSRRVSMVNPNLYHHPTLLLSCLWRRASHLRLWFRPMRLPTMDFQNRQRPLRHRRHQMLMWTLRMPFDDYWTRTIMPIGLDHGLCRHHPPSWRSYWTPSLVKTLELNETTQSSTGEGGEKGECTQRREKKVTREHVGRSEK
jgi:hypothetical protein